jgi:hypothetical protein
MGSKGSFIQKKYFELVVELVVRQKNKTGNFGKLPVLL